MCIFHGIDELSQIIIYRNCCDPFPKRASLFFYKNKQNQPRETKQRWMTGKGRGSGVNLSVEVISYGSTSPLNVVLMAY